MLRRLFGRLTDRRPRGAELFAAVVAEARLADWYIEGEVPDTIDGRFAALSTLAALAIVRLEAEGDGGRLASVALTERFVEAMDGEHRQLGLGDPSVGKKVRKLVGMLAERVELWRQSAGAGDWIGAVRESLYRGSPPSGLALQASTEWLRGFWGRLQAASIEDIASGRIG